MTNKQRQELTRSFTRALAGKIESINPQAPLYESFGFRDVTYPSGFQQRKNYVGVFFAAVNIRAQMISHFMQELYVERRTGQHEFEGVEFSHPWVQLLDNMNPYFADAEIWEWMSLNVDLTGRADFVNEFDGNGRVVGLLPLFPEFGRVETIPSVTGGIKGWAFYDSMGRIKTVEPTAITRIVRRNPLNPYQSMSLIEAAQFDLEEDHEMREARIKTTKSGGFEASILTTDKELTGQQSQEISKSYKEFIGKGGRGKVMALSSGMKPLELIKSRDLQYIEGKTQTKENILFICGVPKGVFESATTRATAEAARYQLIDGTIAPAVRNYAAQLTKQLAIVFGSEPGALKIRSSDMVPLDPDYQLRKMRVELETGVKVINEIRRKNGDDEFEGGDVPFIPMSWKELKQPERTEQPRKEAEQDRTLRLKTRDYDKRTMAWRAIDEAKKRQASLLSPSMQLWYDEVEQEIKRNLRDKRVRSVEQFFTTPFDTTNALERLFQLVTPDVRRTLEAAFDNVMREAGLTGLEFSLESPYARQALNTILMKNSSVPETLANRVSDIIREDVKAGKSNREILSDIDFYFDDIKGSKENIVNGITTSAWESGQDVAYHEAGITRKVWLTSRDERVRPSHFDADGQNVGTNETFDVGGSNLRYPADPDGPPEETIGCRCSTQPSLDDNERKLLQREINLKKKVLY